MKCPRCGYPRFRFVERIRKRASTGSGTRWEKRTSQKRHCARCGYKEGK